MDVIRRIENLETGDQDLPSVPVIIEDCGEITEQEEQTKEENEE